MRLDHKHGRLRDTTFTDFYEFLMSGAVSQNFSMTRIKTKSETPPANVGLILMLSFSIN